MTMTRGFRGVCVALSACALAPAFADELDLAGEWTARRTGAPAVAAEEDPSRWAAFPYAVPGGIQSALLKAGRIPDSFVGTNEVLNLWVGKSGWVVSRTFEVSPEFLAKKEIVLRLEDCDCFATVYVNAAGTGLGGAPVGETTDRFQRYEFDVKPFLRSGTNEIQVVFRSPEAEGEKRRLAKGRPFPMSNLMWARDTQAFVRKPACHAGWDWGPSVQVMGLCGTVKLIATDAPRVAYVYSTQDFSADFTHCTLTVTAELSDGSKVEKRFEIGNPPLWWPNGAGEQRFYEYAIDVNGERLARKVGLRKVEVLNERTVSADGKEELSLVFRVNGRRLFMRGANWIPCSAYENGQTPERYRSLVTSAKDANMNMLRVWGGGQYEKDVFYDLCDENGILLWHDMMCSCAVYPGDEGFLGEVRAELGHQLRRLRDHACLAMWCGDNECLGAINWFPETKEDPDYYREAWIARSKMQGELVAELDPARTYWPSSPCCGPGDFGDGWKEDSKGDMHNWDVWHENQPFAKYYEYHPRFCSEFGFQSFPSMEVAETFATRAQVLAKAPEFEWHQKNPGGNERIRRTMARYFPPARDVESSLLLSQFQQAMAIQTAVDAWRAEQPRCMGALFWQLNDNWPVASWSSIEYGGKWKPLQYLAKRFFAPLHVVMAPDGAVSVVNDTDEDLEGDVLAVHHPFDGGPPESVALTRNRVPAGTAVRFGKAETRPAAALRLVFRGGVPGATRGVRAENFPVRARYNDGALPSPKVSVRADGFKVTLTTDKPAFWVWANVKGVAGEFDDNAITLVPGVPRTLTFAPARRETTEEEFKARLTVVSLADLVDLR